jgi:hypothetical protein
MSRSKLSLVIVGAIAAAGIIFAGANLLNASSGDQGTSGSCASDAKTTSSCAGSGTKTAGTSGGCPSLTAAAGTHKECPVSSSGACAQPCGPKAVKTAAVETISEREGARVVLVGHYACGHCDLGLDGGCQPAFQTKDGKNFLLSRNNLSTELKAEARDKDVEIVTRVKRLDGAKYLEVEVIRHAS